jgi:hypothetical protein
MNRINFKILAISLLLIYCTSARAQGNKSYTDSARYSPVQPVNWSLSSQLHSASFYFFTGMVDQPDQSFDMLYIYDNNGWGWIVYKSFDLLNHNTGVNYAIVAVHKHFKINENLRLTPNVGMNLNQNWSVADRGSDLMFDLVADYRLSKYFSISNDAIFQNMAITKDHNWTNRLKLSFNKNKIETAVLLWDRNRVFNNQGYFSTGFTAGYNGFKLTPNANLGLSVQSILMLQSDTHASNGLMFTMAVNL